MTTQSPSRDGASRTRSPGSPASTTSRRQLVLPALAATVVAAVATTLFAALAKATFADLKAPPDGDESIPVYAFAFLTIVFSVIGIAVAAGLRRWSRRPDSMFVRIAVTLTAISLVPPFLLDTELKNSLTLVVAHLIAAVIIIPVVANRLAAP